jgi:DNA-binding response OmpR family regulator
MNVLVAEEHDSTAGSLRRAGHEVTVARSGREVRDLTEQRAFDAVVLALHPSEIDGPQLYDAVRTDNPGLPIVLLLNGDAVDDRVTALDAGADDCLPLGCPVDELLARLRALVRRTSLQLDAR